MNMRKSRIAITLAVGFALAALASPQLLGTQNVASNMGLQNWAFENFNMNLSLTKTPAQLAANTESMRPPRPVQQSQQEISRQINQQIQEIHAHIADLQVQRTLHAERMRYHSSLVDFHLSRFYHYSGLRSIVADNRRRRDNHMAAVRRHGDLSSDQSRQRSAIDAQIAAHFEQLRQIEGSPMPQNRLAPLAPTNARIVAQNQLIQNIDPILVGRNVVFSSDWLQHIGNGQNQMTAAQFALWRDRTDKMYDAMAHLMGMLPFYGERVTINIKTGCEMATGNAAAHAHGWEPAVCYNADYLHNTINHVRQGSWSFIHLHEMGHVFDLGSGIFAQSGESKVEPLANFIAAFAMDITGAHFLSHECVIVINHNSGGIVRGQNFRDAKIAHARQNRQNGNLRSFSSCGRQSCAFSMYLHEFVNRAGWEPVMLALRSYQNPRLSGVVSHNFNNGTDTGRALDFFGRIQDFSGNPNLKLSVTGGAVLNQHFNFSPQPVEPQIHCYGGWC